MTTAVLVPSSEAVVNAASAKSIAATAPTTTSLGNKNTLDAGRDNGGEEHSTGASANAKLSATSAADAASAHVDEIENANTSNTNMTNKTNNTNNTNNGMAGAVTRAANHLKRCKSTPDGAIACGQKPHKKRRRVSFESADIVEFEPTMFTTTVTSGGIPLGMSLTERSRSRRRLDSWELERQDLRVGRQNYMEEGYLDPAEREQILLNSGGCGEQSMLHVEAEVNQIIAHRRESNEVDFDFLYGLVSIGEEGGNQEDDDEDEDEEEEEEEERDIEEVQLMSQVEGDDDDAVER